MKPLIAAITILQLNREFWPEPSQPILFFFSDCFCQGTKKREKGFVLASCRLWMFSCDEHCENCADDYYHDDDDYAYVHECVLCG